MVSMHDAGKVGNMTNLIIKYDRGTMTVNLEEFLSCRSISRVRKLLKLIARSENPELTEQIQTHIEHGMSGLDDLAKISANQYVGYVDTVKELEHEVERWVYWRSGYKKSNKKYEYYNDKVKESREKLRVAKADMQKCKKEFDDAVRDKNFFEKLLLEVFS